MDVHLTLAAFKEGLTDPTLKRIFRRVVWRPRPVLAVDWQQEQRWGDQAGLLQRFARLRAGSESRNSPQDNRSGAEGPRN